MAPCGGHGHESDRNNPHPFPLRSAEPPRPRSLAGAPSESRLRKTLRLGSNRCLWTRMASLGRALALDETRAISGSDRNGSLAVSRDGKASQALRREGQDSCAPAPDDLPSTAILGLKTQRI